MTLQVCYLGLSCLLCGYVMTKCDIEMLTCLMGRRGVATFPEGVPEPPGTLRMMWSARGVRVGISSISRTQCFWFTTLTCPEVCPAPRYFPGFPPARLIVTQRAAQGFLGLRPCSGMVSAYFATADSVLAYQGACSTDVAHMQAMIMRPNLQAGPQGVRCMQAARMDKQEKRTPETLEWI